MNTILEEIDNNDGIGEKTIMVQEEVKTKSGITISTMVKEKLDIRKDKELGEFNVSMIGKFALRWTLYLHENKDGSVIFYIYYAIVKEGIQEVFRVINKKTAITMLSRMNHIHEQKIEEYIPNFETEKLKVQLHDRIFDSMTDKEIEENLNTVQSFSFFGEEGYCGKAYPHLPHIMGYYNTVRYGSLPLFCLGKSGKIVLKDGRKVQILITKSCKEGNCHGKYAILEEEE